MLPRTTSAQHFKKAGFLMEVFTVSFFGHRELQNALVIEGRLEAAVSQLIRTKPYVEFLVGRDGEFDLLLASTIRRCKRTIRGDNSSLVWVLPYETAEFRDNKESYQDYYDEIEICEASAGVHYRSAHQARNKSMIDRSDLVICCIDHESGGAYQSIRYARKQGKQIINLKKVADYE